MIQSFIRKAAYHAAIMGNPDVFKDKVVMDVGTGSGILAGEMASFLCQSFYLMFTHLTLLYSHHFTLTTIIGTSTTTTYTHVDNTIIVWAAQAGAKRVYAIEYTAMANHARRVVQANGVDHIVTVIQGAVEDVVLPEEDWDGVGLVQEEGDVEFHDDGRKNQRVVDIILSG